MTLRALSAEGHRVETVLDRGWPPELNYLSISDLVVDESYQRPISKVGWQNILKIAANFHWLKFAAVIVAPVFGGKYAIVDGQHRTTAALILGIERVPCSIVPADQAMQAAIFKAVNGNVTQVHPFALHYAALTAGEAEAVALDAVCTAGGAKIPRYPISSRDMKAGETLAIGAIRTNLRLYGPEISALALKCITATRHNAPGALRANAIAGIAAALNDRRGDDEAALLIAADRIDLGGMIGRHPDKTGFRVAFAKQLDSFVAGVKRGAIKPTISVVRPAVRESSIPAPGETVARPEAQS